MEGVIPVAEDEGTMRVLLLLGVGRGAQVLLLLPPLLLLLLLLLLPSWPCLFSVVAAVS